MKQELINKIKELKSKGKKQIEISKELNIPVSTVQYYFDKKHRIRGLKYAKEYRKTHPIERGDEYRKYQREYHLKWYQKNKERLTKIRNS